MCRKCVCTPSPNRRQEHWHRIRCLPIWRDTVWKNRKSPFCTWYRPWDTTNNNIRSGYWRPRTATLWATTRTHRISQASCLLPVNKIVTHSIAKKFLFCPINLFKVVLEFVRAAARGTDRGHQFGHALVFGQGQEVLHLARGEPYEMQTAGNTSYAHILHLKFSILIGDHMVGKRWRYYLQVDVAMAGSTVSRILRQVSAYVPQGLFYRIAALVLWNVVGFEVYQLTQGTAYVHAEPWHTFRK